MTEKIPQHKHCSDCGKAVPVSERFCSDNCKEKWEALLKKRMLHYRIFLMFTALIVFMVLFGGVF